MADKRFQQDDSGFQPGKRLNIQGRVRDRANSLTEPGSNVRDKVDRLLKGAPISPANENINTSTVVGAVGTAIVWALEDYLPGRVGADASISDAEVMDDGVLYTIDTNAVIESQARFRSMLDAGTGITSLWTDEMTVESIQLVKQRPARDTYRYEIKVSD